MNRNYGRGLTTIGVEPRVKRVQRRVADAVLALHERAEIATDNGVGLLTRFRGGGDAIRVQREVWHMHQRLK